MTKVAVEEFRVRNLASQKARRVMAVHRQMIEAGDYGPPENYRNTLPGFWAWFCTPLGRYDPNTGRHLTSGERYKITFYDDGSRDVTIVS